LSKHAAFHIENSVVAPIQKIAAGGGGELYIAKLMDNSLSKKHGEIVVQKVVFVKNKMTEEAFYLEVGIMIMLSSFPHFCKIIGYTENPKSLILNYYSSGSLKEWIQKNPYNSNVAVKIMSEVSSAVRTLHSNFLAHCDLKTQNILVEVTSGVPSFFLTDFGITQVLSDRIISSRMFTVVSMKGISVQFASPESFEKFRSKNYTNVDFKMFDIYSFSCVIFNFMVSTLQHEKSFMFDRTAASVLDIDLYKRSLLITSSNDIVQKDIETGNVQRKFLAHSGQIHSFKVIDGSTMITSAWDDMIIVWDLVTGSIVRRIWLEGTRTFPKSIQLVRDSLFECGLDGRVRIVSMITDVNGAANVIVANDDSFYVGKVGIVSQLEKYSISTRSLQLRYEGHLNTVHSLILWDQMLFSSSTDTKIICWNEENGQIIRTYEGHPAAVQVISIFNNYLYSGGQEAIILKWNIDSGVIEKIFPFLHGNRIWCFAFEEGTLYSGSIDTSVIKWDLNTSSRLFSYFDRRIRLRSIVMWKNVVIAGGDNLGLVIQDRSQNSFFPVQIMSGHTSGVLAMIVFEDTLFSGGVDRKIRHRSLIDYSELKVYQGHSTTVSALGLDDKYLYSGSYDFTAIRWNITSGSIDKQYVGHAASVSSIQNLGQRGRDYYPKEVTAISLYNDDVLIVGTYGLDLVAISTTQLLARQTESFVCFTIVANTLRIYTGHDDGLIRGRDSAGLNVLESFQGHQDFVMSLCLDDVGILFSTGFDGSVKKWNMGSRRVSFSYENRNGSVTALTAASGTLFVGTRQGWINTFDIRSAYFIESITSHKSIVTSLVNIDGTMYSSGFDGMVFGFQLTDTKEVVKVYDAGSFPVTGMAISMLNLIAVKYENEIIVLPRNTTASVKKAFSPSPIVSIAANDDMIFAGSRAGSIVAWSATSMQIMFSLEDHESQANALLIADSSLYSASNDKSIIKWSLEQRTSSVVFKRLSAAALGHLGPVNSISVCGSTLFSAGSDLTTRRWNTITGRHEDVYFGTTKSVTSVSCYNGSVFSGSEDFSVLMYSPTLPDSFGSQTSSSTSSNSRRSARTRVAMRSDFSNSETTQTSVLIGGILAAVITVAAVLIAYFYWSSKLKTGQIGKGVKDTQEFSDIMTDLETVVNTVVGISKHAAYLVANSSVACIKKLATGGGGDIFLARVMTAFLTEKTGNLV
ncbi:hypothetical protein MP638_002839, partial [Amoeboaphelidium occidentale]